MLLRGLIDKLFFQPKNKSKLELEFRPIRKQYFQILIDFYVLLLFIQALKYWVDCFVYYS